MPSRLSQRRSLEHTCPGAVTGAWLGKELTFVLYHGSRCYARGIFRLSDCHYEPRRARRSNPPRERERCALRLLCPNNPVKCAQPVDRRLLFRWAFGGEPRIEDFAGQFGCG